MLFKRLLILLLFLVLIGPINLIPKPVFADYWVPKLDLELGLGCGLSQNDQQLGHLAILYEPHPNLWVFGDYTYAQERAHETIEINAVQRVSLGARYVLDFLRLRPWFSLRLGLSDRAEIEPVVGSSLGLSYLLSEDWQLSLWTLVLVDPVLNTHVLNNRLIVRFYGLLSLSYSFVLGESFDEL